ncbi:hypothetical protein GCM10023149_22940 [Mucilaginibacter gynuensis]|uniref:Beta-galactosidase n=1 Tax=Mucilaginibacter gynuensis TaxID=1302236 RepID=A0ABP8GDX7_9SPHI
MKRYLLFIAVYLLLYPAITRAQQVNDHIFKPAPAAKSFIDFDNKGFMVNGKRTFLVSAGLEYARVPRQLWRDRLMRIKRAGFNCVEVYTIWNFHEPVEGKFNFSGDADLDAFLNIVKELGLYSIVRVGPYYCAEWDSGGYPIWLKFKKGLRVREHNALFEQYVDRFFDKLLPIVFKHQINHNGSVILVQLENEHPQGWGTDMPDDYFRHLQTKALSMGMEVPYFFSGLHHASDPAGDGHLDDAKRPNPWFSTEFWSVWYNQYGAKPADAAVYDRRTWKIIAHGGNGYNYYMAHGGSNFGYTNNDEDAASYDYGAAVGQAGDLRPIYYAFKRASWFSRSFEDVLENSVNDSASYSKIIADTALKVSVRKSPEGSLIFIDNPGKQAITAKLNIDSVSDFNLNVSPGEIYPLVHQYRLNQQVTLNRALTRIYAIVKQGNTITIITDAEQGARLYLDFTVQLAPDMLSPAFKLTGNRLLLDELMSAIDQPKEYMFETGDQIVRVLAMNRAWTDRTFIDESTGQNLIISGADYIHDVKLKGTQLSVETEAPLLAKEQYPKLLYTANKTINLNETVVPAIAPVKPVALSKWTTKTGWPSATTHWTTSANPLPMGADADVTANAWYKTSLKVAATGKYILQVKGNGRGQAFVDGKAAANWKLNEGEVSLNLKKGTHQLTIFTAHDGRDKLAAYIGPLDEVDSKGIFGPAVIKAGGPFIKELTDWYFVKAAKNDDKKGPPAFNTSSYGKYKIGADVFNLSEGYAWFHNVIAPQHTSKIVLQFKSVDENAVVFINGKEVHRHVGWNQPFEIVIDDAAILKNAINLDVFIENYSNEGGIDQPVKINTIGNVPAISGWQMKGGPGSIAGGWKVMPVNSKATDRPVFYRTTFTVLPYKNHTLIWRFNPKGLGHGSVWVNGHNLGRYPEKAAAPGLYIPECWLNAGANELVIYDEDGKKPLQTSLLSEPEASRKKVNIIADIK